MAGSSSIMSNAHWQRPRPLAAQTNFHCLQAGAALGNLRMPSIAVIASRLARGV
jgi:hypothetical protein